MGRIVGGVAILRQRFANDRSVDDALSRLPREQASRSPVRPNKDLALGLGAGELVWNLAACDKEDSQVVAALIT